MTRDTHFPGLLSAVRAAAAIAILLASAARAQAPIPTGVTFQPAFWTDDRNKLTWPVALEEIPNAPGRFLVLEKNSGGDGRTGRIWLFTPGSGVPWIKVEFLTLPVFSENVSNAELGLLGIAFHPRFAENRKYYLDYNPDARTHVVEERLFTADFSADAGQAKRILSLPANSGHNGGSLAFGPDGFLYVSTGDAANPTNGQSRATLHGKILRLDVDNPSGGRSYGIPADNPFQGEGERAEIFALGLRNPWKIAFDPVGGALWAGDVGQTSYEEVDRIEKGGNYGWAAFEGTQGGGGACGTATCAAPATFYGRNQGRSIIGGHVYRGQAGSPFYGVYIFGDYQYDGPVFGFRTDGASGSHVKIGTLGKSISAVARDSRNNLYVIGHDNGIIYRLVHPDLQASPTALGKRAREGRGSDPGRLAVDLASGRVFLKASATGPLRDLQGRTPPTPTATENRPFPPNR